MFLCLTVAVKAALCQSGRSEKGKMVETMRCESLCPWMIWRGIRRYCSGWWRARRKLDAIRGALTGKKAFLMYNLETLFNNDVWPAILLVVGNYAKFKKELFQNESCKSSFGLAYSLAASPAPRKLRVTRCRGPVRWSGRGLCTLGWPLSSATVCSPPIPSSRTQPCPPTQPPTPSHSWKRHAGGLRKRGGSLERCRPSRGERTRPQKLIIHIRNSGLICYWLKIIALFAFGSMTLSFWPGSFIQNQKHLIKLWVFNF